MSSGDGNFLKREVEDDLAEEDALTVNIDELMNNGLPTEFNNGYQIPRSDDGIAFARKNEKQNFVCKLCDITDLNSLDTKLSHERGQKHMLNLIRYKDRNPGKYRNGIVPGIVAVAPQRPLEKKDPMKLSEKLKESSELVVGLEYVSEIIACSSVEEPYYLCDMCGSKGIANGMFNHLAGKTHKQNLLKTKEPDYSDKVGAMSSKELVSRCQKYRNEDYSVINTIYSDEMYPWEAGKAPWSVEQNGTGRVPDGARDNINIIGSRMRKMQEDSKAGIVDSLGLITAKRFLENIDKLEMKTTQDLITAYDVAIKMIDLASDQQVHSDNPQAMQMIVSTARMAIKTLQNIKHKFDKQQETDDEPWNEPFPRNRPSKSPRPRPSRYDRDSRSRPYHRGDERDKSHRYDDSYDRRSSQNDRRDRV